MSVRFNFSHRKCYEYWFKSMKASYRTAAALIVGLAVNSREQTTDVPAGKIQAPAPSRSTH